APGTCGGQRDPAARGRPPRSSSTSRRGPWRSRPPSRRARRPAQAPCTRGPAPLRLRRPPQRGPGWPRPRHARASGEHRAPSGRPYGGVGGPSTTAEAARPRPDTLFGGMSPALGSFEKALRFGEGRRMKRLAEQAVYIATLEPEFQELSDEELRNKTAEFR